MMIHLRKLALTCLLVIHFFGINPVFAKNYDANVSTRLNILAKQAGKSQIKDTESSIDIILTETNNQDIREKISTHNGKLKYHLKNRYQVRIPKNKIEKFLSSLPPGVTARLPYPHSETSTISQAVALTGAEDMHILNTSGLNVKVGIIDLGFSNLAASQSNGNLPANISIIDYTGTGNGGTNHGTNVAEIVYDMAPAAELYLAKVNTSLELEAAINDMIANGIQVINHSVAWFGAAFYDGTGPICELINTASNENILWVNAAGNSRNEHYLSSFTDNNNNLNHDFLPEQDYNTISVTAGTQYTLVLNWDDYITQNKVDYNLFIYDGDPAAGANLLASSTNAQYANYQLPLEIITYTPMTTGTHYIVVKKRNSSTPHIPLTLFAIGKQLSVKTQKSSIIQPADCQTALSVAAANLTDSPEWFSSEGPTTDGRNKPDVSGTDRVITSLSSSFVGTSAAAPHVTGAAALLIQQNPGLNNIDIKNLLINQSHDIHTTGFDYRTGHGRISLDADNDSYNHDSDNCRLLYNPDQDDSDNNLIGDICEPPTITGFWPSDATAGEFIFIFGSHFSAINNVTINGINTSLVQIVSDDMLIFILPEGDTNGHISLTNDFGSDTSSDRFGTSLEGLQITGVWPSTVSPGDIVFVFGNGFIKEDSSIFLSSTHVNFTQFVDENLILFVVPTEATSSQVTIQTSQGSVSSQSNLVIK